MNELSAPLKRRSQRHAAVPAPLRRHFPVARVTIAVLVALGLFIGGWVAFTEDPDGGRPTATAEIQSTRNSNPLVDAVSPSDDGFEVGPEFPVDSPSFVQLPEETVETSAAPTELVEQSEYGPLPRVSSSGATPFSTYARASVTPDGQTPMVAVIVSGMGLNLTGTLEAIQQLPDDVTLAFAPYGKSLERGVSAAQAEGHELFLEVPLEPFDYPDNDPGPDTLLTGQPPRDNLARLYTVMGSFSGYAGLINNMGARFTASGADFSPMMEELGSRGLGYLDDGSSNRSLAPQLATANAVPFAKVDLMLDAKPQRAAILEQLNALEARARQSGRAIGIISALPVSVTTVAEWSKELESRGVTLVPASALMQQE
ncbi:divergent polysaccharide deacetylase family protein [Devosia sp.]|uniref:divergent polysaccharide deacetylase family protein n=1 Tax=Devosia sp. TaxID=1871048 RepID=UPI003A93CB82